MKTNLKILILAFILLNIVLVSAEEFTINKEQTINYKGIPIKLLKTGSYGSANLEIGKIEKILPRAGILEFQGLRLRHILSEGEFVKLDIEMIAECLQDSDCNDYKKSTKDTCVLRACKYEIAECCIIGDECKEIGSVETIEGETKYCSDDFEWTERKAYKFACSNNYECLTNYCNQYCRPSSKTGETYKGKMAPAWLIIIFAVLIILKSLLFAINPKLGKRISTNIIKLIPNNYCRYVSIIAIIIGLALIYWALI